VSKRRAKGKNRSRRRRTGKKIVENKSERRRG
jgi:hypothetical protein